jgi:FG-GAP-like repeat
VQRMSYTRPSARTSVGVLAAIMMLSIFAVPVALGNGTPPSSSPQLADPNVACGTTVQDATGSHFTPGFGPTKWTDDLHPPTTVRVLRSQGPNKGHVETVNFFWYVGVVMRAEYSSGGGVKPPLWMRIGAIAVKEYGWYKARFWGGGRVSFPVTDPVTGYTTTTSECYDLKDTTADQLYKPEKFDPTTNTWNLTGGNVPNANINRALRETWQISLRKWIAKNNVSRLFLSGYRSGNQHPCGTDATGFKIFQKSLHDCVVKNLTTQETLRRYYSPMFVVNARDHDMMGNGTDYVGDLGVLSAGSGNTTSWRLYASGVNQFAAPVQGSVNVNFSALVGYGVGNVDAARTDLDNNPGDPNLLADLVTVTGSGVQVAHGATGGLASNLVSTPFPSGTPTPDRAVIGDFNGDLLVDVGLVYFGSPMQVMTAKGDGTFNSPVAWGAAIPVAAGMYVAAADVNGDGKDDLIVRDLNGFVSTALSSPSCSDYSTWGLCPTSAIGASGLAAPIPALTNAVAGTVVVGDYDRDSYSDLMVVAPDGKSVQGMRGRADGTFADPQTLWQSSTAVSGQPVAMNINADGMTDIAFVGSNSVTWLRMNEKTVSPATMTMMQSTGDSGLPGNSKPF